MFAMKDISQLILHTVGISYLHIHVVVRVTEYPVIYATILDVLFQFHGEGTIGLAVSELGTLHLERRNMMCDNYLSSGLAA